MAASLLFLVLFLSVASGSYIRYYRDIPGHSSSSSSLPGHSSSSSSLPGASSSSGSFPGAFSGSGGFPGASSGSGGFSGASSGSGGFPGASSGSGGFSGASSFASSSSSSSSGTKVNPGPGGYGNFNAFSGTSNFGNPPAFAGSGAPGFRGGVGSGYGGGAGSGYGGGAGNQLNQPSPFGAPGFNPFVPQYGQAYPYTPFPTFAAPFDFMSFLNQYFQALQGYQAQAEAQAQQAAAGGYGVYHRGPGQAAWAYTYPRSPAFVPFWSGGYPSDNNDVGGVAMATYSPQGGYGSANIFPKAEGGLETRFGGDEDGGAQNSVGPVSSVSGSFKPPSSGTYGVFTSSSSGSSDINGKKTSFKQSSIGINDNGKVTTYTAHDP